MNSTRQNFSNFLRAVVVTTLVLFLSRSAPAQEPAGTIKASHDLHSSNSSPWGLAYRGGLTERLYVSDATDDWIYVYERTSSGLVHLSEEDIDTGSLGIVKPRGLGYELSDEKPFLYVLTSTESVSGFDSSLWRISLDTGYTSRVVLNNFGLDKEVHGLAVHDGVAYISYDTSSYTDDRDRYRKGILQVKVAPNVSWFRARKGYSTSVVGDIPHACRPEKKRENRAKTKPCYGVAFHEAMGEEFLWGTSNQTYVYAAEAERGRGLFVLSDLGNEDHRGLAAGDNTIFVVDRHDAGERDQILELEPGVLSSDPVQGKRKVRRVRFELESKITKDLDTSVTHNYALPMLNAFRPSQGLAPLGLFEVEDDGTGSLSFHSYYPAGDSASRCYYTSLTFSGSFVKGERISTAYQGNVWISSYRSYVYPHRCDLSGYVPSGYVANDDELYDLGNSSVYSTFVEAAREAIEDEYGDGAWTTSNPYWLARNLLEYILETYHYDGGPYHPATLKLALPFDSTYGNETLSCSSTAFALSGVLRWLGVPTRWVGTTKARKFDTDDDGFWDTDETATDTSFHRWIEVWLGERYGWQRFDATPGSLVFVEYSQFELMQESACGVGLGSDEDLVMHVGSKQVASFYDTKGDKQRYNAVPIYARPSAWKTPVLKCAEWTNPCGIKLTQAIRSRTFVTVYWNTSGPWSLDPDATVSVIVDGETVASGVPWDAGSARFRSSDRYAYHDVKVVKDGDEVTGASRQFAY